MKNKIKDYGILGLGAIVLTSGLVGMINADTIATKIKKDCKIIKYIAFGLSISGAIITAFGLDSNLYPDELEDSDSEEE